MKVELSDRAEREMKRINTAWRGRANSPDLFLDELLETITLIETTGLLGTSYRVNAKRRATRLLMQKCGYHVYLVQASADLTVIVSIWSARRERGPRL